VELIFTGGDVFPEDPLAVCNIGHNISLRHMQLKNQWKYLCVRTDVCAENEIRS